MCVCLLFATTLCMVSIHLIMLGMDLKKRAENIASTKVL